MRLLDLHPLTKIARAVELWGRGRGRGENFFAQKIVQFLVQNPEGKRQLRSKCGERITLQFILKVTSVRILSNRKFVNCRVQWRVSVNAVKELHVY